MTRARYVLILALVLFNIIVLASAAEAPKSSNSNDTEGDEYEDMIGTDEGDSAASPNSVVAGPIGGPVPPGAFDDAKASAPSAASSSLHHFYSVAGAATTTAIAGFIYF